MELKLYNTLTREKEPFRPLHAGQVGIYTCGPTVYAEAHIGNLRSYVFPDILKKTLRRLGYQVRHVINVTDVGHLTSDADTGEDKLERAARQAHRSAREIADEYERLFLRDLERLHIERPDYLPHATAFVQEAGLPADAPAGASMIALIQRLEAKGLTYRTEDGLYFDTGRFPHYGALARLHVEGLQEGARVEMGGKRHKTDFALWKFSPPGVQRQMEWDSPWGRGFPGWHIECSAMSMAYLGETFDIHTGGTDHIPVHHSNEIAQSEGATGHPFVRYWLHGEHLVLGEDTRMGKSEGNFIALQALVDQGFEPLAYRYLVLNTHYRKFLNFSFPAMDAAREALKGLRQLLKDANIGQPDPRREQPELPTTGPCADVLAALCDDLNTPKALATLWTTFRDKSVSADAKQELADFADRILSLDLFDYRASGLEFNIIDATDSALTLPPDTPADIVDLAQQRIKARLNRNYAESDRLRDLLLGLGWRMQDSKDGYTLMPDRKAGT